MARDAEGGDGVEVEGRRREGREGEEEEGRVEEKRKFLYTKRGT